MTPPLLDREVLDGLFAAIGAEGARSVVELFIDESRGYAATIGEAAAPGLDADRRERARRAAHALKSGAGQIGAMALAAAAAAAEGAAETGAADLPQLAAETDRTASDTIAALQQFLNG
jgi:HPt (histidine-containing phosphotransfer) domain-containing protein